MKKKDKSVIGIMGNIASGKSTLAERLAVALGASVALENPEECPYLSLFYQNPDKWAFQSKMWFLHYHVNNYFKVSQNDLGIVDGTIWDDKAHAIASLAGEDMKLYSNWHELTQRFIHYNLIVYLRAPIQTLEKRVQQRARNSEVEVDISQYLDELDKAYEKLVPTLAQSTNFFVIDSGRINFAHSHEDFNFILSEILQRL